jgi:hypothetical protein
MRRADTIQPIRYLSTDMEDRTFLVSARRGAWEAPTATEHKFEKIGYRSNKRPPGTGEGSDSALGEMIKRRALSPRPDNAPPPPARPDPKSQRWERWGG